MSNETTYPILNPFTPLAFLEPSFAVQVELSRYVYVGTLGAFIWDWLMSMSEEYNMVRSSNRPFPIVVYFISRFGAFGYILNSVLFQAVVIPNCQALLITIGICCILAMPGASFLFYIRVWAIFYDNRWVRFFFALLWLSVLGTAASLPFALKGNHIGTTQYCMNSAVQEFSSGIVITTAVNDTLILAAIWYKLFKMNNVNFTWQAISGNSLSMVSKIVLQSGFMYYITTIGMNLLTMIMVLTPSTSPVSRAMAAIVNIGLQNAMACRVFRKLKLGVIGKDELPSSSGQQSLRLSWRPNTTRPFTTGSGSAFSSKQRQALPDDEYSSVVNIKVTRDVEFAADSGS